MIAIYNDEIQITAMKIHYYNYNNAMQNATFVNKYKQTSTNLPFEKDSSIQLTAQLFKHPLDIFKCLIGTPIVRKLNRQATIEIFTRIRHLPLYM